MNSPRLLAALTVVNLLLLAFLLLSQIRSAQADNVAPVLRARALQIVDDRGRVRAGISVQPASVFKGKPYAENVILRLIDQHGRPEVKIIASTDGGAVSLVGRTDEVQALLAANKGQSGVELQTRPDNRRVIAP